jgi:NAD(P)H-dependent flavin oxidoreductase YrpB (nitropropane dioxygenase family)
VEYFQLIKKRCFILQKQMPSLLLFTGRSARSIRNRFIEKYLDSRTKSLAWLLQALATDGIYAESRKRSLADYYPLLAGQGLRLLMRGQSANDIVNK